MDRKRRIDIQDVVGKKSKAIDGDNDINPWTGEPFSARYHSILEIRTKLPVYQFKDKLLAKVMENQVVIVEGETGSGKRFVHLLGIAGRFCATMSQSLFCFCGSCFLKITFNVSHALLIPFHAFSIYCYR